MIFIISLALIFITWLPFLLQYYPGIISPDSCWQVKQVIGVEYLRDSHPIVHTAIVGLFMNIGMLFSNDINVAVAFYSIASMGIMAMLNTVVIMYLKKNKAPTILIIGTLLYYMFYPVHAMYSITMWKDVMFSGVIPIFIIFSKELLFNTEKFFSKKSNIILYIIIMFFVMRLRHNGFYVVILFIPFVIVLLRKYWKKTIPLFLSIIIIHSFTNYIIFGVLKVAKGSIAEMMSIPIQQMARVQLLYRDELDQDIVDGINKFFTEENIGDYYLPGLSDYVKDRVNVDAVLENKLEFI